ncbi:hypothetical protein Q5P01_000574 [Channa striata]|uniref:Uncharacterized protein n=1 Tax=Channa striata TaxID=64152 RepID=A0AA88IZ13_CHASR|nr:hypothetical protein Q5P01_000574 [Channa striata]
MRPPPNRRTRQRGARRGVVQPFNPWVDEDQSDREARSVASGAPRNQHEPHAFTHAAGEEDTDIEIHWVHILHSWKKFLECRLGALCSIAWKGEKDKLRSHAIVLNRGMYTCTDLRGYFDSPTNIAVDLSRLRGLEILSKPRHLMSHKKSYFYDSRIPTQLRNIKDALKGAWWGTYSRRQSLATMESVLRNLTPFHARVGPYGVQLFDLSCGAETRAAS